MTRYRFGEYEVDTESVEVTGPDGVAALEPQAYDVLVYLLEQHGRLVTKEELLDNVWGDRFVSESALTTRIKQARRSIGDDGRSQHAIKTVHGRGYRFVAELLPEEASSAGQRSEGREGAEALHPRPPEPSGPSLPDQLLAETRRLFVGREAEVQRVTDTLLRAEASGSFGWVWLLGEPGIGKTRLAAEAALVAHGRGHRVWFGRNNEDLRVPYQPFIEAIRAAVDDRTAEGRAGFLDGLAPELAPLLPAGGSSGGGEEAGGEAAGGTDEARRYRMFDAFAAFLADQAAERPITIIVDDVHWAADSTLQLLFHLANRPQPGPVTLLLTARDTAPDSNERVADLVASVQGRPNSELIRLDGLSEAESVRLVGDLVPLPSVMRETAGNPLLLQAVDPNDGSVDVDGAVRRRLAKLNRRVQETLLAASVIGLEFELRIAAEATSRDELDVLDDLEEAIAARLLDDVGVDRFRFTHALIRSSLRQRLSSSRRSRLHRQIAEAIESVSPGDASRFVSLAYHTAEAAEADTALRPLAVERLERAGLEATRQLSFGEAAAFYQRAASMVDDEHRRARLTLAQGIAETKQGLSMPALDTLAEAMTLARKADDPGLVAEAAVRYEDANWRPGLVGGSASQRLTVASGVLDAAVASGVEIEGETELRARLAIGRLRSMAMSGMVEEVEAEFEPTLTVAREMAVPDLEASLLNVYLSHVRLSQGLHGTEELIERLVELIPAIDAPDVALHAIHVLAIHAAMTGDRDGFRRWNDQLSDHDEALNSTFWLFTTRNRKAMDAFYRGDLSAAEELAEACLEVASELPDEDGSGAYGLRMFLIRREQDQLAKVAPLVRHVLASGDVTGVWTPGLALLQAEIGDLEGAADLLGGIKDSSFDLPDDGMWSTVVLFLIETMVRLGDSESCATLRTMFEPLAGSNVMMGSGLLNFGSADRLLGMLSFTLGELDRAAEELSTAVQRDTDGGSPLWANDSRLWLARVRQAQGKTAAAEELRAVVADQAAAAGLIRLARIAAEELAEN